MDILIGIVLAVIFVLCMQGAYLIVRDKDTEYRDRKQAEKNFKRFMKDNDYKVIGKLTGVAAQTECARYNPDTGKFEWLKENG